MSGWDHCCRPAYPSDASVVGMASIPVRLLRDANRTHLQNRIQIHLDCLWLRRSKFARRRLSRSSGMISGRTRGRVQRTRTEVQMHRTSVVFEKSALHPVCQQTAVTAIEPGAAATSPAARGASCSGPEQGGILPVISTLNSRFHRFGSLFQTSEKPYFFVAGAGRRAHGSALFLPVTREKQGTSLDQGSASADRESRLAWRRTAGDRSARRSAGGSSTRPGSTRSHRALIDESSRRHRRRSGSLGERFSIG